MRITVRLRLAALLLASGVCWLSASCSAAPGPAKPKQATGLVVDVQGRPVAGAAIEVSITDRSYHSVTIGSGATGPDGRFLLPLSTSEYGDLGLGVEAPGFEPWGWAGYPQGIRDERIVLGRKVDRAYLDSLQALNAAERSAAVLEIAASDELPEIEEMLPYLAALRPGLLELVRARTAAPATRRDGSTPADHAASLLAYWAEPADDEILAPWLTRMRGLKDAPALSGITILELCGRWRTVHFEREKVSKHPPFSYCTDPVFDPDRVHGLLLFQVRYAYWGYNMYLVIRKEGERWVLRRVLDHEIQHYKPARG